MHVVQTYRGRLDQFAFVFGFLLLFFFVFFPLIKVLLIYRRSFVLTHSSSNTILMNSNITQFLYTCGQIISTYSAACPVSHSQLF